ncbi:MAG: hypothetical protein KHW65_10330, partial [Clostridiales bacterium]|nr:hypothetical protein [Clostridiales bacterium]
LFDRKAKSPESRATAAFPGIAKRMDVQFGRHFASRCCRCLPSISCPPAVFLSHLGRHLVDMVDRDWKNLDKLTARFFSKT